MPTKRLSNLKRPFTYLDKQFKFYMQNVEQLYKGYENGEHAMNTLNGIAGLWNIMSEEITHCVKNEMLISNDKLTEWNKCLEDEKNSLAQNRGNIVRADNKNTLNVYRAMEELLHVMTERVKDYQKAMGDVCGVENQKKQNVEEYNAAKAEEEENKKEAEKLANLKKPEDATKQDENLIKVAEDKKEEAAKQNENLIKNAEDKKEEPAKQNENLIKNAGDKKVEPEKQEENLIKKAEDKKVEPEKQNENLIKNVEEDKKNSILNADAGDQKIANEKAAGAKKKPNWAKTVKDLRKLEKALAATNESLFTKQSNQFAAFCNCLRVLNRTLAKSGGKVTPENAEKIGKAYVALTYARHKYYVHCEKHPKTNKVRVDRVRLVDQTMKKLGDLKGLNPDICKAENAVLANENNQLAKMETTYNATAAHGEYIRSMEAIQSML